MDASTEDRVWALVHDFGPHEGRIAAGPFDSAEEACAYDPLDDRLAAIELPRAEFERRTR